MLRPWRIAFAATWVALLAMVAGGFVVLSSGGSGAGAPPQPIVLQRPAPNGTGNQPIELPGPSPTSTSSTASPEPTTVPATTVVPTTVAPTTVPRTVAPAPVPTAPPVAPRVTATTGAKPVVTSPPNTTAAGGGGDSRDFSLIGYHWSACQTITVTSTGPDISGIVSELASITGLHLQMVNGPAQITVQWGAVAGGGEVGLTDWRAVGGLLTLAGINISHQGDPYLATLLRHELGHAMGLGHASHPNEIMYPTISGNSPTDYQAGDLAGLRAIGASGGC